MMFMISGSARGTVEKLLVSRDLRLEMFANTDKIQRNFGHGAVHGRAILPLQRVLTRACGLNPSHGVNFARRITRNIWNEV
jgi:hypothetical protein